MLSAKDYVDFSFLKEENLTKYHDTDTFVFVSKIGNRQ